MYMGAGSREREGAFLYAEKVKERVRVIGFRVGWALSRARVWVQDELSIVGSSGLGSG
jgi:hypothetical protein